MTSPPNAAGGPDRRPPKLCPHCFAGTPPEATTCWLCQSGLPAYEQRPTEAQAEAFRVAGEPARPAAPSSRIEPDFVIWTIATVIATILLPVLAIDVGFLGGGVGYGVLVAIPCAPVIAALAMMVWLRRPGAQTQGASLRGESTDANHVTQMLGGVAMTVTSIFAMVGLIALLILALLVLAFVACLAAVGAT